MKNNSNIKTNVGRTPHRPIPNNIAPTEAEVRHRGILSFVDEHANGIAAVIMVLTALVGMLLFSVRLDEGGDDSNYICRALDLVADGTYPNFQNPLYPIFLSLCIVVGGGLSVVVLKAMSLVLIVGAQAAFWFGLRRSMSRRLLLAAMLMIGVCPLWLRFGSLTYSEPLFALFMMLSLGAVLRLDEWQRASGWKRLALWGVLAGLALTLAFLTRTVGLGLWVAALGFLLVRRRWTQAGALAAGLALCMVCWYGIRAAAWGNVATEGQMQQLIQVHPYDPSQGTETPVGFLKRLGGNAQLYLSKHYVHALGIGDPNDRETFAIVTVIVVCLMGWGTWRAWQRRNRTMLLVGITTFCMLGITFLSLQVLWDQCRLVIPYVPLMHLLVLSALADLIRRMSKANTTRVMMALVLISSAALMGRSVSMSDLPTLQKNLTDDPLYGNTPDWYNYLTICREVGNQLNSDSVFVACRKPDMARLTAGGKKFYGIYRVPSEDPDTLVNILKTNGVTHVIVASLRRDPLHKGLGIINTVHRYVSYIIHRYPRFIREIGHMGNADDEPAYIYALDYKMAEPQYAISPEEAERLFGGERDQTAEGQ